MKTVIRFGQIEIFTFKANNIHSSSESKFKFSQLMKIKEKKDGMNSL